MYYNHYQHVQQSMRRQKKQTNIQIANVNQESVLRRGTRERSKPKYNQDFKTLDDVFCDEDYFYEEDYKPRKMKKKRDNDDYVEGKIVKKKNVNRLVGLLGWKRQVEIPQLPEQGTYQMNVVKNICKTDLSKLGKKVEGIFVNIKWSEETSSKKESGVTIQEFAQLNIESTNLLNNGIVFIWIEKLLLGRILKIMTTKGYDYVENFQIVFLDLEKGRSELAKVCGNIQPKQRQVEKIQEKSKSKEKLSMSKSKSKCDTASQESLALSQEIEFAEKEVFLNNMEKLGHVDPSNMFLKDEGSIIKKSKQELMLFRKMPKSKKEPTLELRHQRNSDVIFDIVNPKTMVIDKITKAHVYNMIETLLPRSLSSNNTSFKLMQLWGNESVPRNGWITVVEK